MEVITMKKCSKCSQVLPIGDFSFRASRGTYQAACKDCKRAGDRAFYASKHGAVRQLAISGDAENRAFRQWGVPELGRNEPELGMPVGVLSPSVGLVLGVAA